MNNAQVNPAPPLKPKSSYKAAVRHSNRVRTLKIAIPAVALLVIAVFVGTTMMSRALPEGASVESVAVSAGKLVMNNPVMTGQIGEGRGYSVRAMRAVQDLAARSVIRLEDIVADFPFDGSEMAVLSAISGIYNQDEQFLSFDQPFTVTTEDGMKAEFNTAHIDIETGILTSDQEVIIDTDKAKLVAKSVAVKDRGAIIIFGGGVQMTIKPGAVKSASDAQGSDS